MRSADSQHSREIAQPEKGLFLLAWLLTVVVLCPLVVCSLASASVVGDVEVTGLISMDQSELLYLLNISPGSEVDADIVRSGIKRAFLKDIFDDVVVEVGDENEGEEQVDVVIQVKERDWVDGIAVSGAHALSGKKIRELFPVKQGDRLACGMLEKAVKVLRSELSERGFPRAAIRAELERLGEPYKVNINLIVDTGKPDTIEKIMFSGVSGDIKSVMKMSEGDVFNRILLQRDIERIREYLKREKYFKPVVGSYVFAGGILNLPVSPGKRLDISVEGNDHVSTKKLLREMPFFETEEFSEDVVAEAVHRMRSRYHAEGYPFAEITYMVTLEDEMISLRFSVSEGVPVDVGKITFSGNSLPSENLKKIMSLKEGKRYNPELLDSEREILKNLCYSLGYLSASVEEFETQYDEEHRKMNIFIRMQEGLKTVVGGIVISGAQHIPDKDLRKAVRIAEGDALNNVDISDARYRILELYGRKGFPEAVVRVTREIEDGKARITFHVIEDGLIHFGKVIVAGNRMTKYEVIRRELVQEEGKPFDFNTVSKERQRLYGLGLFTAVDAEILDGDENKRDVLLKVREGNPGMVEFSVGYGDYERYRGMVDLSYRNLMGMNRQVSLRVEGSSLEKRYILQYFEPWFSGSRLPFRAYVLGEDKKEVSVDTRETRYQLTRHTVTAGFEKKLSERLRAELFYEFSLVNTFDVKPDVILSREDTGTLVISGLRSGLIYDTRDNPFYPQRGILSGISVKFTAPVFLSETSFLKLSFYGNTYQRLTEGVVLALSLRGGIAQGFLETNELPIVERFFLGGGTTVRGYDQDTLGPKGADNNPTGGNAFFMENLELRTSLGKGIGVVAFLDGGNVWQKMDEIEIARLKFASGLGLRYDTPVGPLRVDYGFKLQKEKGESSGELHFSIGHAF